MTALALLGFGIVVPLAAIALLGNLRQQLGWFVLLFLAAFAGYAVAAWRVLRRPGQAGHLGVPDAGARRRVWLILGFAAAFRLIMLAAPPTLSDDLFRYIWEGRVVLAGGSPYAYAPDDPRLAPLRDDTSWTRINNKGVPSPYPPIAQLGGVVAAALSPHDPVGMKVVSLVGDVGVIAALVLLLRRVGTAPERVLLYAWHPLTALEFSHSGHNDSLMVAPLVLALALVAAPAGLPAGLQSPPAERASARRRWAAAILIGIASLAKITPLLLLPLLPRRLGILPVAATCLLIAAAWAPLLHLGSGGSIVTYLGSWQDNDSVHALLRELLGARAAKIATLLVLAGGVIAVATHRSLRDRPLWWQTYVVLGLSIALASTVHAWYLTWLLPLLAVGLSARPSPPFIAPWSGLAWLVFSGLVVLPYLTYDTHRWHLWISFAQYLPFYALLGAPLVMKLLASQASASPRVAPHVA